MKFHHNTILSGHWNQLGVMLNENYDDGDDSIVVMGTYVHQPVTELRSSIGDSKLIVYQTEPLVDGHWHNKEKIIRNIIGADEVWDYDLENIDILKKYDINAKFRPPAYTNKLKTIQNIENPDIDILFYGSYTDYRCTMINNIFNGCVLSAEDTYYMANCKFVWLYNMCENDLDYFISRSKIVLNMRPYENATRQQQTRIYYPLINDKCVLSERANINYFGDNIIEYTGYVDLWHKIPYLLRTDTWKSRKNNLNGWLGGPKTTPKIAIFYHVYQYNDWRTLLEEQLILLQHSGLYDVADYIHIGINGIEDLPFQSFKINRIKYNNNLSSEADTLIEMSKFCELNPEYNVLYFHTKGTGRDDTAYNVNITAWRKYLEHFVIGKWKECNSILKDHDCVGTEWKSNARLGPSTFTAPCYSGNFWWATAEYVNKLKIEYLLDDSDGLARWKCELWIGTADPKFYNFYSTDKNKYLQAILPEEYINI